MKNKTITIICLVILIIIAILLCLHIYDLHNGKIEPIPDYIDFGADLEEMFVDDSTNLEQHMQVFFANSNIERQGNPITTPQQVKKLAQKVFFKQYGLEPVTLYRPYTVYHDNDRKTWYVSAEPWIYKYLPVMGHSYFLAVTDDGYIVATLFI